MPKELYLCDLLDIYGSVLTEKQRNFLELYYCDDLSLAEIAENEGGSRQGALDMIKRAGAELINLEKLLQISAKNKIRSELLKELKKFIINGEKEKSLECIDKLEKID